MLDARLVEFARRGELIVMAGAGVSAGRPSALPGWKPLNAAISHALCHRLESSLDRPGWLADIAPLVDAERDADRFPPEYQAQLIEEMCGERYFRALQALDIDVMNPSHDGIAALAAAGAVRAVVTTNFDRLIEQALDGRGLPRRHRLRRPEGASSRRTPRTASCHQDPRLRQRAPVDDRHAETALARPRTAPRRVSGRATVGLLALPRLLGGRPRE